MTTQRTDTSNEEEPILISGEELSHTEIRKQLERIVSSTYFRNSKRYPTFLRFVVEHTLAGNTDVLKERTLGTEVFARPSEYDTNADPIVRVTAGEIRKRIAQYYQMPGHEHELRIDLPLGSYVPRFLPATLAANLSEQGSADHSHDLAIENPVEEHGPRTPEHIETTADRGPSEPHPAAKQAGRRLKAMLLTALALVLIIITALFSLRLQRDRAMDQAIQSFWRPIFSSSSPVLIVIGVHSLDNKGNSLPTGLPEHAAVSPPQDVLSTMEHSDMVPVGDIVSYSRITMLLTRHSHLYQTQGSSNTNLEDLLRGPVILFGGLDNIWSLRLTAPLRYRFFTAGDAKYGIRDSLHPANAWTVDYLQPVLNNSRDYAIVASYFDHTIEQRVMIAAGVGKNGTTAATEFLTTEKYMSSWARSAKLPKNANIELVLSTEILDGQPGPPHVLASYSW